MSKWSRVKCRFRTRLQYRTSSSREVRQRGKNAVPQIKSIKLRERRNKPKAGERYGEVNPVSSIPRGLEKHRLKHRDWTGGQRKRNEGLEMLMNHLKWGGRGKEDTGKSIIQVQKGGGAKTGAFHMQ